MALTYVCAYCDALSERIACEGLAEKGYEPYCPSERYYSRRFKSVMERPLFPRYLFVGLDAEVRQRAGLGLYSPIRATKGVRAVLDNGQPGKPGLIIPEIVEAIRRAEQLGIFDATPARLKPNDKVRFMEGPFASLIGKIKEVGSKAKIQVLFDLMGREVAVWAPLSLVERV